MTASAREVRLRDVTLRETTGPDGSVLSVDERLALLALLAGVPVAVAEAAAPGPSREDAEFFRRARAELDLGVTELSVVGRVTPCGPPAPEDDGLASVLSAGTSRVSLVVDGRVAPAATDGCGPAETMTAVAGAISLMVAEGRRVLLDVEHAVDAFGSDPVCLVDLVATGLDAGVDAVVLDDTAGLALPDRVVAVTEAVAFSVGPDLGVACGDASGCAVANTLLAVGVGARWLQTSARPGAAALTTTVLDLLRGEVAAVRPLPDLAGLEERTAGLTALLDPHTPDPVRAAVPPAVPDPRTRPVPPARRGAVDAAERPLAQA